MGYKTYTIQNPGVGQITTVYTVGTRIRIAEATYTGPTTGNLLSFDSLAKGLFPAKEGGWIDLRRRFNSIILSGGSDGGSVTIIVWDDPCVQGSSPGVVPASADPVITLWYVVDTSPEQMRKCTVTDTPPWTDTAVGTFNASALVTHVRVAESSEYIFTLEFISPNWYIRRRALDFTGSTDLQTLSSTNYPWSFCIHRGSGTVYWVQDNGTTGHTIKSMDFDGGSVTTVIDIVVGGTVKGKMLAVDNANEYLYYIQTSTSQTGDYLYRVDIAGGSRQLLISNPPLNVSGEVETSLIDDSHGSMFTSGSVPATSEGVYETTDIAGSPTGYTLITPTSPLSDAGGDRGLALDRNSQYIYYAKQNPTDDINRATYAGADVTEVMSSATGGSIKGICGGVD